MIKLKYVHNYKNKKNFPYSPIGKCEQNCWVYEYQNKKNSWSDLTKVSYCSSLLFLRHFPGWSGAVKSIPVLFSGDYITKVCGLSGYNCVHVFHVIRSSHYVENMSNTPTNFGKKCETNLNYWNNFTCDNTGRFIVKLPVKCGNLKSGESFSVATSTCE